jgi:serine/threonine protein kinase
MDATEAQVFIAETLSGRYRPRALIGSGEFCGTFIADDPVAAREVAAKILRIGYTASPDAVEEFRGEVELLKKLARCDRVVDLLDEGRLSLNLAHPPSGGTIPVITEFAILELAAGSLAQLLLHGPSFSWPDRLRLYRDVVKGVHQMHLQKVVHRDIKADNTLVFDNTVGAKVADLGRAHDTATAPRFIVEAYLSGRGDLRFAPLEFLWLQGTQDPHEQALADIYLLGSLLFEVGTGVGLTSMITRQPLQLVRSNASLPEDERLRDWQAQVPWLREVAKPQHAVFAQEVPSVIRQRSVDLLRLLTDPDPQRRLPGLIGGRRVSTPWDLQWLLHRIDGLRRAIDPTFRKHYLAARPRRAARPRARKP